MTAQKKAEQFVEALQKFPALAGAFNPWRGLDPLHYQSSRSPTIMADHLARYLAERIGTADNVLIGEEPGYQGCHFSGMAMTSERIVLGFQKHNEMQPEDVVQGAASRTSKEGLKQGGYNEPTATIVWKAIKAAWEPTGRQPSRRRTEPCAL